MHGREVHRHVTHQGRGQDGGRSGAQPQLEAACFARAKALRHGAQFICLGYQAMGSLQHLAAEGGELAAPAHAVQQRLAQFVFQTTDAAAERRLCDEQRLGGAAEGAGLGQ